MGWVAGTNYNCSLAGLPQSPVNSSIGGNTSDGCFDKNCDIFKDYYWWDYAIPDPSLPIKPIEGGDPSYKTSAGRSDILLTYQCIISNDQVKLNIANSSVKTITLKVMNILGEIVSTNEYNLNGAYQEFVSDISKLASGTYVYTITSATNNFGSGKFVITK